MSKATGPPRNLPSSLPDEDWCRRAQNKRVNRLLEVLRARHGTHVAESDPSEQGLGFLTGFFFIAFPSFAICMKASLYFQDPIVDYYFRTRVILDIYGELFRT